MFQRILTNLKSWAIKIFLGLIALSFAVWGVGDIFRGNSDPVVASIGNIKIRASELIREYDRELKQLREMSGGQIDAEQARAFGIVESALQQIINRASLDQHSGVFAMGVPDSLIAREIRSSPNFRNQAGEFDRRLFEYAIAQNSMDEESFIAALRSDITRTQLVNSLLTGIKSPNTMTEAIRKFRGELRSAEFIIIDGTE
ncbi:MAG: SurA N-terminal domain-containing protein, partial [Alphaproteobacteria bacterium]